MTEARPVRSRRDLARVVFRRRWGIVGLLAVAVGATGAGSYLSRWTYRSRAVLVACPSGGAAGREELAGFAAVQAGLLKSEETVARALMRLDGRGGGPVEAFLREQSGRVARCRRRVRIASGGRDAGCTLTVCVTWPEDRAAARRAGRDARELAAERAQAFAACLLAAGGAVSDAPPASAPSASRATGGGSAQADVRQALGELERCRQALAAAARRPAPPAPGPPDGEAEAAAEARRAAIDAEMAVKRARLKALEATVERAARADGDAPEPDTAVPAELLRASPSLRATVEAIARQRIELKDLRQRYTDAYGPVGRLKARLADALTDFRRELTAAVEQERERLEGELAGLGAARAAAGGAATRPARPARPARPGGPTEIPEHRRLQRALDRAVAALQRSRTRPAPSAASPPGAPMLRVVDAPSRPRADRPHRPVLWLNLAIAAGAGLLLALAGAFAADRHDHAVRGADDVERSAGVEVLASVPVLRRGAFRAERGGR